MPDTNTQISSNTEPLDIVGVVLAGGKSRRMGQDKRYIQHKGKTFFDHAQSCLAELPLTKVVISDNDIKNGVNDYLDDKGPVGGMLSVIMETNPDEVEGFIFVPADMPNLTTESLLRLIKKGRSLNKPVCYHDCYLPLFVPSQAQLLITLKNVIDNHNGAVKSLIQLLQGLQIDCDDPCLLLNINRPDDLLTLNTSKVGE